MIKSNFAVIFDMDGVLVDTVRFHWQAMNQVLARYNIHIEDNQLRNYIGQSVILQLNQISEKSETELDVNAIIEELKPIKEHLQIGIQPKEGVTELLKLLVDNQIPIAIGTSSSKVDTDRKLNDAGILKYFHDIVTHDDVTEHKPNPAVYITAADRLNVNPENCIVFEDAPSGIAASKRAGMLCIAVGTPYTTSEDLKSADVIVKSLLDVNLNMMEKLIEK